MASDDTDHGPHSPRRLALLAAGLPDDCTVYHAVHWTAMDGRYAITGEVDFAVVNRAGDLLLIEQKSGFLQETAEGLVKQYPGRSKSVPVHISRMVSNLRGKLAARADIPDVHVDALLYCPDYTVRSPETAGRAPERIVDARRRDRLSAVVAQILPARQEAAATPRGPRLPARPDPARHRRQRADGPRAQPAHPRLRRPRALGAAARLRPCVAGRPPDLTGGPAAEALRPRADTPARLGDAARTEHNYRSSRPVAEMLRRLLPVELDIKAASPIAADEIAFHTYADTQGLIARVKEAVRECYPAGFRKHDLAIVSYHGREHSQLMPLERLGQTTLRRFTGDYGLFGQPVFSDGDVLLESVYRLKGQAAPAGIFAEIDFAELDDQALRKLFVGATRGMLRLTLILHEKSAVKLLERIA